MSLLVEENASLTHKHTMQCPSHAAFFAQAHSLSDVDELILLAKNKALPLWVIGEGSNTLCSPFVNAVVFQYLAQQISMIDENEDQVLLRVEAGLNWHELVEYCAAQQWWGIENLALIPGLVGAAPIQNIGAYGVEFMDVCHSVEIYDFATQQRQTYLNEQCGFSYRHSIFKQRHDFLVTAVVLQLAKKPAAKLTYGPLQQLDDNPSCQDIVQAVSQIRQSKLPNPKELANSGSFFHNPIISAAHFKALKTQFSDVVAYEQANGEMKLAAGWLIEQCQLKGQWLPAGSQVYAKQSLVLTNPNGVDTSAISQDAHYICQQVKQRFAVDLVQEPVLL